MHLLLTGAAGLVGSAVLGDLLDQGHTVTALDICPLPTPVQSLINANSKWEQHLTFEIVDMTDRFSFERVVSAARPPLDGVIHLGAIPNPIGLDPREVHNNNVTSSYNVLQTCAALGIRRIVQASSVNAPGLSYTPDGHQRFDTLPITEDEPMRPEDPYALSKAICELQATSLCRYYPGLRIASLRFHMCRPDYASALPGSRWEDLWGWVSFDACTLACLLGLTSEGWQGHEAFNIVADSICDDKGSLSLDLLDQAWSGRYRSLTSAWWAKNPRRGFWDCQKAKKLLGWRHDL